MEKRPLAARAGGIRPADAPTGVIGRSPPGEVSRAGDAPAPAGRGRAGASPWWSRAELLGLGILLLAVAWFWWVRVVGPRIEVVDYYASDLYAVFVPLYASMQRALRAGSLPFWNGYLGCGTPQLAMLQTGSLYPPRLLLLFLSPTASLEASTIGHVVLAAVGSFALARSLRFGPWGSLAAAIGFTWGMAFGQIVAPASMLEPGAWLPLLGLGIVRLCRHGLWRDVVLVAVALAAPILAGGYQVAVYVVYGAGLVWLGLLADPDERPSALAPSRLALLAFAGLVAVGISSPQWLPTLLWSRETLRPTGGLTDAQIDPWGAPVAMTLEGVFAQSALLPRLYLPLPLLVLAALGVASRRRSVLPLSAGGLAAFLLSLGGATPFFRLYRWLPGFSMFRLPYRLGFLAIFAASLAAAAGVDLVEERARERGRVFSIVATLVFCLGLLLSRERLAALDRGSDPDGTARGSAAPSSAAPALGGWDVVPVATEALSLALPPPLAGPASLLPLALSAIGVRRISSWMPWGGREGPLETQRSSLGRLAASAGRWRIALVGSSLVPGWTETQAALVPFFGTGEIDPLASRRLSTFLALAKTGEAPTPDQSILPLGALDLDRPPVNPRLLDMASVRFLAAPRDPLVRMAPNLAALLDAWPAAPRVAGTGADPGLEVRSNPHVLPRAYLVPGWLPVAGEAEAASAIVAPGFDPAREVVVEAGVPARPAGAPLVPADIEGYEPEHVVVRTDSPGDAMLVLTDAFAPGWRAEVDGREAPVWPANLLFRAVRVPAGRHVVTFTYATPGFRVGMVAAMVAVAILLAGPLVGRLLRGGRVAATTAAGARA